jgi:hypothetical protein
MKKFLFILIILLGCDSNREYSSINLKSISIEEYIFNKNGYIPKNKICLLTNPDTINVILSVLNSKKPAFRIFMPEYNISLNYKDSIIGVGVSQKYIKIKGKTFKVNKNLCEYFATMKKH